MNEELIEKVEWVIAIRGYEEEERQKGDNGVEFTASHGDDKILFRFITKSKLKSGIISADTIREVSEDSTLEEYDKVFFVGESFTVSAKEEMKKKGIKIISNKFMPYYKPDKLYTTIQKRINDLCQSKCGQIPKKESECKGYSEGVYSCKVRLISDNTSFHITKGWETLLQNDLKCLLAIRNYQNNQNIKK